MYYQICVMVLELDNVSETLFVRCTSALLYPHAHKDLSKSVVKRTAASLPAGYGVVLVDPFCIDWHISV